MSYQDHHTEFEELLQHHADRHRMFPSDRLWQQIQTEIHGRDRWPALTVATIAIISLLTLATALLDHPAQQLSAANSLPPALPKPTLSQVVAEEVNTTQLTRRTMQAVASKLNYALAPAPELLATTSPANEPVAEAPTPSPVIAAQDQDATPVRSQPTTAADYSLASTRAVVPAPQTPFPLLAPVFQVAQLAAVPVLVKAKPAKTRLDVSAFGGASRSFRLLTDDNYRPYTNGSYVVVPTNAYYNLDVNQVVNQAPSVGYEFGLSVGYWLTNRLRVYGGVQANYREYKIQGYGYNYEPARIALRGADTLNTLSQYRLSNSSNLANSQAVTLRNQSVELSMPVGLQWEPFQGRRLSLGLGANLQPTYVLSKTPFVVSTDYKSYAQSPELMRQFNFNTSVEAYLRYQPLGRSHSFTLGPQIRYQQLPTLSKRYPIREYLYDYGLRLSFTKSF